MQFFGKKEQKIIELFEQHLFEEENTVKEMINLFENLGNGDGAISEFSEKVRIAESKADSLRRKMEEEMYLGGFLPNFRGDLLGIVESIDVVANKAETVADEIELQRLVIPENMIPDFIILGRISLKAYQSTSKAAITMLSDLEKSNAYVQETRKYEHESDVLERTMVKELFIMDIDLAEKILIKKLITKISDIADHSENVSDRIQILIFKRRV